MFDNRKGSRRGFRDSLREEAQEVVDAGADALSAKLQQKFRGVKDLQITVRAGGGPLFFGRRVIVPTNEIHVVNGAGRTNYTLTKSAQTFGSAAGQPILYWTNDLTEVVGLSTEVFMVPVVNVNVLDKNHVPYFISANVVAQLDVKQAEVAARSVGKNLTQLETAVGEVTSSQLWTAAATFTLEEVIQDQQRLSDQVEEKVRETLSKLGYTLNFLRISELGGAAYDKLVEQADAITTRNATIQINAAQLATEDSKKGRERRQAELDAQTRKETEEQRLGADQAVNTATADKDEAVAARRNTLSLAEQLRAKELAAAQHDVAIAGIDLKKQQDQASADASALVALLRQSKEKELLKAAAQADADRQDLVQARALELAKAATESDAERLRREKTAEAERNAEVQKTMATAGADALGIKTEAEVGAKLRTAEGEAQAAEKTASAAIKRAEATRAVEAAAGLAAADVQAREVEIDGQRVAVERDRGLATAAVAKEQADANIHEAQGLLAVELERARAQAELFDKSPALRELETLRLQHAQALELARIHTAAKVQMMQAIAPQLKLQANIIGDGSRASQIMAQVMAIASGAQIVGDQVPLIGNLLGNGAGDSTSADAGLNTLLPRLMPFAHKVIGEMNPRAFSSLTLAGFMDSLLPVLAGREDLLTAVQKLREKASFRIIADAPVAVVAELLGIKLPEAKHGDDSVVA